MRKLEKTLLFLFTLALLATIPLQRAWCGEESKDAGVVATVAESRYIPNKIEENSTPLLDRSYGIDFLGRRVKSNQKVKDLIGKPISDNVYSIGETLADLDAKVEAVCEQIRTRPDGLINPGTLTDARKNVLATIGKLETVYGEVADNGFNESPKNRLAFDIAQKAQDDLRVAQEQIAGLRFKQYGPPTSYTIKVRFRPDQQNIEATYLNGQPIDFRVTYVPKNTNPKNPAIVLNPQDRPSSKVVGVRLDSDGYYAVMICDDFDRFEPSGDGWTTIPIGQALGGLREERATLMLVNVYGVSEPNKLFRFPKESLVARTNK